MQTTAHRIFMIGWLVGAFGCSADLEPSSSLLEQDMTIPGSSQPPPTSTAPCPSSWVGSVCWNVVGMTGGVPNFLYHCNGPNAAPTAHRCSNSCQIMPPGVDDQCYQGVAPCQPGWVGGNCGSVIGGEQNTRYYCNGYNPPTATYCYNGCIVAPPGQDDHCAPGPACDGTCKTGCPC
jgi:hypothetical protein